MNTNTHNMKALLAAALLTLAGCATTAREDGREAYIGNAGTHGNFGNVQVAEAPAAVQAGPKVIVVSYRVNASGWKLVDSVVAYGSPGGASGPDDYTIELVGPGSEALAAVTVWDPRKAVVEQQGIVTNPEGLVAVRLPFHAGATAVRVRDREDAVQAEDSIREAVARFCRTAPDDPDCARLGQKG